MFALLQMLIDREAKPLVYAAAEAVTKPTKKALGRALWALGFSIGALTLAIAGIGVGTVAITAILADLLPDAQIVLSWAAAALLAMASLFCLIGVMLAKAISPSSLAREGKDAFINERHRRERAAGSARSTSDPVTSSYAFARGFADGLKY
ncbi:MAG: hypothetical protein RIC24_10965 [Hyphomicrobiales bacterium]|jgi:hypothetical protein